MTILQISILAALAIIIGFLRRGRELLMLAVSALAIFWLQGPEPLTTLQYWLPFATLGLAVLSWAVTATPEARGLRQNWPALVVLAAVVLVADLNRYFNLDAIYTTQTPRALLAVAAAVAIGVLALAVLRWAGAKKYLLWAALAGIVAVFLFLKTPALASWLSTTLAGVEPGSRAAARLAPLTWLGYSYVAFRLMHTIRDRQSGRLPAVTLTEYVNYVIFFPSFTAGPIDRIERFIKDYCAPQRLTDADWIEAGTRLFVGLFKKFVVADLLAVISINDVLVQQVKGAPWLWFFLYAYALRIYFDFSGYTDIAIGIGRLMGIRLPENFAAPYLKPNITQFWNAWHITLTQWFRSYFFNPVTRALRSARNPMPTWLMILLAQFATMVLIGLWHGVTAGFVIWGLWHGLGLFLHNRWSGFMKPRTPSWMQSGWGQKMSSAAGVFLTFNFVAVGWLFFTLSSPAVAWQAILKLFGAA